MDQHSSAPPDPFSDPQSVARYKEGPPRIVPGFADMQRMTTLLLSECVPQKGRWLGVTNIRAGTPGLDLRRG